MPLRHGIDVSIVSSTHETFTEYGVNTHGSSKLVNAKIEARTGVQFYIVIRPEHPFLTAQNQRHGSRALTRARANDRSALPFQETPPAPRKGTPKFKTSDLDNNHGFKEPVEEFRYNFIANTLKLGMSDRIDFEPLKFLPSKYAHAPDLRTLYAPLPAAKSKSHPFDLIAEVFLDGRAKAEIRSIIYLDPTDFHYSKSGTVLKGRRVRALGENDGPIKTCIHDWVFTDVGIEVLFERMGVEDAVTDESDSNHDGQEIASLAEMLQDTANVDDKQEAERELKVGKIEVLFTRVVLGNSIPSARRTVLKSLHYQDGEQQTPKKTVGKDVTHTTSIVAPNPSRSPAFTSSEYNTVKWKHYNPAEDFYAKFTFDYTSRAKLVKWGLCNESGVPVKKKRCKEERHVEVELVSESEKGRGKPKGKGKGKGKDKSMEGDSGKQDDWDEGAEEPSVWEGSFPGPETRSMKERGRAAKRSFGGCGGDGENEPVKGADHGEDRRARLRPRR